MIIEAKPMLIDVIRLRDEMRELSHHHKKVSKENESQLPKQSFIEYGKHISFAYVEDQLNKILEIHTRG